MSKAGHSPTEAVTACERVSDVLARDESLIEVFVRHSSHFEKLRSPALRKMMARLVTVEQAARVAGVSTGALVDDLNRAIGVASANAADVADTPELESARVHPADAPVLELDVREDLRSGREPFSHIMGAVSGLDLDAVLHLRAIFEPAPLYAVLEKRGFAHETQRHAADDWSIWFWRPPAEGTASRPAAAASVSVPDGLEQLMNDPNAVVLDVRNLEPPEPLVRTMAAAEQLEPGQVLVQVNLRVPQFLLPMLTENGYAWEVDESRVDRVLVRITRASA